MGLRHKKEGLARFIIGCQLVFFVAGIGFIVHKRYYKEEKIDDSPYHLSALDAFKAYYYSLKLFRHSDQKDK